MNCPCCSGKSYENCCKLYHTREKDPPTAEALMRSRFSAFAIPNADYLWETTLPSKRKYHNKKDLQDWGARNTWTKLEIVDKPAANTVEFKAFYTDESGHPEIHHELSTFRMVQDRWFYVSGIFIQS
ncbi:YchJ family metal-binding protein [uncultured Chryseobacterium sp.]|uniref:YchJ family protein n=1 Tax=uncultured Chryseobacterium sp. TaxID=259322 RepID=UPI0025E71912|nr:YchJ family metal-binding protein [uncultured Chryseobacterium sp.]